MEQTKQPVQENPNTEIDHNPNAADNKSPMTEAKDMANTGKESNEPEVMGEFSDAASVIDEDEKKPRKEFTPLDLGNESNVSDWIVNMLSGRLMDFAVSNIEWVGDWVDRSLTKAYNRNQEKRNKKMAAKEAALKNNQTENSATNQASQLDTSRAETIDGSQGHSAFEKKVEKKKTAKIEPRRKSVSLSDAAQQLESSAEQKKETKKVARRTKTKKEGLKKDIEKTNSSKKAILNAVNNTTRGKTVERSRSHGTER